MMQSSPKRVLTDDKYASSKLPDSNISEMLNPDLAARLRSVGSRVRKHVTEGYVTNQRMHVCGPTAPAKSLSTGHLTFSSANDTLRAIFPSFPAASPAASPNKRRLEDSDDEDHDTDHGQETQIATLKMDADAMNVDDSERPVKPLKKSGRALMQTRSLPSCVLQLSQGSVSTETEANNEVNEDDWSSSAMFSGSFEPMAL
ncbi:uncharacterized protein EV420DRAFT_459525 [Desarmillaria tabescens]|uniref:Uncharacterized protein n=1 Tax=Armillaria tabescens TaxID=1929756 RepID=A0AA39NMF0_ARMTA|nr:uncharacterized protein EV420DRAFT_459525 [Desarmillaria tabescens]KAK0468340.1 hypothetical protein EV420DRAFT_459525 [Desarmillaria tabescens]